jgi:DNA-binding GntR family transcriptional regulator
MGTEAYFPLTHTDLTEQTYGVLKDRILQRQLLPGERISVDEVARGLGVSRTPVNDALKRLASEGLVEIVPRRGTFVSGLTAQEVNEWFDIRLMIELHAADRLLSQGEAPSFLSSVREPLERMQLAVNHDDYNDYDNFMEGDRDFHHLLVASTCNEHLTRIYTNLNVHIQVARAHYVDSVENPRQVTQEHDAILAALERGDPAAVRLALSAHITNVKSRILEMLEARGGRL